MRLIPAYNSNLTARVPLGRLHHSYALRSVHQTHARGTTLPRRACKSNAGYGNDPREVGPQVVFWPLCQHRNSKTPSRLVARGHGARVSLHASAARPTTMACTGTGWTCKQALDCNAVNNCAFIHEKVDSFTCHDQFLAAQASCN